MSDLHPFVAGTAATLAFGLDRMKAALSGLTPEQLAKEPEGFKNSIATLVIHTAGTEITFAHRILGTTVPEDLKREYLLDIPHDPLLPAPKGETAESLTAKLVKAREVLTNALAGLTEADLDREITLRADRKMTVRGILALLPNHAAQHMGHIQLVKQHV